MAAGASSLLKSAASRRAAIQDQQNRMIDMEWQLSEKTADDLSRYIAHYDTASQSAKSSDQLSFMNKITSARRSYTSNEIQRATIRVMEGTGSNEEKLNIIGNLYEQAVDNGDMDQAQNLRAQYNSFYNTVIKEQQAQANLATGAYNSGYADAKSYIADLKSGTVSPFSDDPDLSMNGISAMLQQFGPDQMATIVDQVSQKYGIPMASFEDMALFMADKTIEYAETLRDSYPQGSKEYRELSNQVLDLKTKQNFQLPGAKLTYDELKTTAENARAGLAGALTLTSGPEGFTFVENKVTSWQVITNPDGTMELAPTYTVPGYVTPASNMAMGGKGYQIVSINGSDYAQTADGTLYTYDSSFKAQGGKISGNKYGNIEDFQTEAQRKNLTPQQALKEFGYNVQGDLLFIPQPDGTERGYNYTVDENGNIQYFESLKDPNDSTKDTIEMITIDTATGRRATASADAMKGLVESKRQSLIMDKALRSPQMSLQGAPGELFQPASTSGLLQGANATRTDIREQKKASELLQATQKAQQAASAQQLMQANPTQPLAVKPVTPAAQVKVTNAPAPSQQLKVTPTIQQPKLSVYQAPITSGTTTKVKVDNTKNTTPLRVR